MPERIDDKRLEAWRRFLVAHAHLIRQIERTLARDRVIPLTWYDVLLELEKAPRHALRPNELANRIVLTSGALSRLIDRIEAAGLVRREATAEDRRGTRVVLTDEGRRALRKAWPSYSAGIADHFGRHLSVDEANRLTALMGRFLPAS